MAEDGVAIGARFQASDGQHRHVWNVRDDRVHYFSKADGSHWTPGHSFDDAPTVSAFQDACRLTAISSSDPSASHEMDAPRAPVMDGDF